MRNRWTASIMGLCLSTLVLATLSPPTRAQGWLRLGKPTSVEKLAQEIDCLEKHIDCYGSIVAKSPDVWGQARLMRHRYEFERQMLGELTKFKDTLNASIGRSDQAFLASATSLSAAISSGVATKRGPNGALTEISPPAVNTQVVNGMIPGMATQVINAEGQVVNQDPNATKTMIFQTTPGLLLPAKGFSAGTNLTLEPTVHLDQMARYLNHLHELRRINEGDDTADSPGYSLNLVRIPISVLPGRKTRKGFGAEITITATPYVSEELLPHTFRSLVINDLVDLLSVPVAESVKALAKLEQKLGEDQEKLDDASKRAADFLPPSPAARRQTPKSIRPVALLLQQPGLRDVKPYSDKIKQNFENYTNQALPGRTVDEGVIQSFVNKAFDAVKNATQTTPISHGRLRRSRSTLPPTQIGAVIGNPELTAIASDVHNALREKIHREDDFTPNLLDVRGLLHEELDAAYDLMALRERNDLWNVGLDATPDVFAAIRGGRRSNIELRRKQFQDSFQHDSSLANAEDLTAGAYVTTRSLAWAILVESILLNDQLNQDMKRIAAEKNCPCASLPPQLFCLPDPPIEARLAFMEYVKCRWPIHVFAVDPVSQDQNVADVFSRRRELQLAMALSFASGRMNAQNLTRYVRRLELDMETIGLNQTIVGFSHGADTFGWRFFPRVQTPPEQSNATVAFRDLLWGGPTRDDDLRQRQLEPGLRECTAIVVMPSFVPYVTIDTRSNWFPLTNCKKPEISMQDTVRLSKQIRSMQEATLECTREEYKYRDGEVYRMLKRVEQLSAELPLQSQMVQVPYENSLGGFEMFSNGTSDLSPELVGFYGEPGIDPSQETHLFLIGDHFSVHGTTVIAGNRLARADLLSRQVMEVTIPAGVQFKPRGGRTPEIQPGNSHAIRNVVDVHVATPYGVSSHLEIPVVAKPAGPLPGFRWGAAEAFVSYTYTDDKTKFVFGTSQPPLPNELVIVAPDNMVDLGAATMQLTCTTQENQIIGTTIEVDPVPFDARRGRYLIGGAAFANIHKALGPSLLAHFSKYPERPPQHVEVRVYVNFKTIANVTNPPPISGYLSLTAKLKEE